MMLSSYGPEEKTPERLVTLETEKKLLKEEVEDPKHKLQSANMMA
jgi:hypothetical protein